MHPNHVHRLRPVRYQVVTRENKIKTIDVEWRTFVKRKTVGTNRWELGIPAGVTLKEKKGTIVE